MTELSLAAAIRTDTGKGASRRLRREQALVPAILYGAEKDPLMLSVEMKVLRKAMENEAFFSQIIGLSIDGKKQKAVLRDVQRHPAKGDVLHLDFLRVTGKEQITMVVPIHFENEEIAPGVKQGGIVSKTLTEIEVKCLPKDIPEFIAIDLKDAPLDHTVHISHLKLPKGVSLAMGNVDSAHDDAIVSIHIPKRAVETEDAGSEAGADEGGSDSSADKTE